MKVMTAGSSYGTLPDSFNNLWRVRLDLFYARVTTEEWKGILLNELDRPIVNGEIVQLVGKKVGPGVYDIRAKVDKFSTCRTAEDILRDLLKLRATEGRQCVIDLYKEAEEILSWSAQ